MRSPLTLLSLCLLSALSAGQAGLVQAATQYPNSNEVFSSPQAIAQWTQEQEERFDAQREAERQRAAERQEQMRQQLQDVQQEWHQELREWRVRREERNDRLQEYWEDEYDQYYGDSEERYIDDRLYRSYGDSDPYDPGDWTFRLRYSDDDLDIDFSSSDSHYPYRYYEDEYYYEPRIIDRVYIPYLIPSFGDNSFVQLDLISETRSNVSVLLIGPDGSQQLAFDAFNPSQSIYLAAGTYQIAFVDAMNDRTWLAGYLDLGFSPSIRIEFNQGTETANLYGDPYAWRSE